MNVAIYIYENAEVLDFSGPFEVFSTASRMSSPKDLFNVFLIAQTAEPVVARGGFKVIPHYSFSHHPSIDVLVIVGGVHTQELRKPEVLRWVSDVANQAGTVASVCTGAFILAEAGLINNITVTTHWEDLQELANAYPALNVVGARRWVDEGKFVTSGGISAGIDMSLHLVAKFVTPELAERTARQMEFDWRRNM